MNEREIAQRKSRIITIMVVFVMLIFVIVNMWKNTYTGAIVFDSSKFYNEDRTTLSEEQLIEILGQPDDIVLWNYTPGSRTYSIKSLLYDPNDKSQSGYTYSFDFDSDMLQRIKIDGVEYTFSSKNHILAMFGLSRSRNSTVTDTGTEYRVTNCGVNDLLATGMTKKSLTGVQITYGTIYGD